MKTEFPYIRMVPMPSKNKTSVWSVQNIKHGDILGLIGWHGPWRQYCFFPSGPTVYSAGCLGNIIEFIEALMDDWRLKQLERGN